jgi:hypothetical protein
MTRIGESKWLWAFAGALLLSAPAWSAKSKEDESREAEARMKKDLFFLASEKCEGRGPTTKGLALAADHVAAAFEKAGVKPGAKDGYFQPFTIPAARGKVTLVGPGDTTLALVQGKDFNPLARNQKGDADAAVVFAGFGVACKKPAYDDYADIDVEGKVVVILRDTPMAGSPKRTPEMKAAAAIGTKLALARKNGAAGVLMVNDIEGAAGDDTPLDFSYAPMRGSESFVPSMLVRRDIVQKMLPKGKTLAGLEKAIGESMKPDSFAIDGWKVRMESEVVKTAIPLKNVVGVVEGAGPLAGETVVVGAHYDHLGYGGPSSLAGTKKRLIHFGADDNASGTTAMLELARRFAAMPNRQGRRLVFIAFSGEELGLLGSKYYCDNPLFPLASTAAMFNLDMVGRLSKDPKTKLDKLLTEGHGTAKPFEAMIGAAAKQFGFVLSSKASGFGPSDHASFTAKGIPVLFLWTGDHPDYHRPTDTPDKIDLAGMARVVDAAQTLISTLTTMERPAFIKVKGGGGTRPSKGPRLGIRPGYGEEDKGVKIEGVTEGGIAQRGGLEKGDNIVSIAGKPVKNIESYMEAMASTKPGTTIDVIVERGAKKVTLKVKLE